MYSMLLWRVWLDLTVCVWRESGVRQSGFVLVHLAVALKMSSHLIDLTEKCCAYTCKDNAAINCITVQHIKVNSRQL
jgi:hypothetical protein